MRAFAVLLTIFFLQFKTLYASPMDSLRVEWRNGKKYIVHRVTEKESAESIAEHYGIEVSQLREANPLVVGGVRKGQILRVLLNTEKYGDVAVQPVVPLSQGGVPVAVNLPPSKPYVPTEAYKQVRKALPPPEPPKKEEPKPIEQAVVNPPEPVKDTNKTVAAIPEPVQKEPEAPKVSVQIPPPLPPAAGPLPVHGKVLKVENKDGFNIYHYKVGEGDNLSGLARFFKTDENFIMEKNLLVTGKVKKGTGDKNTR